MKYRKLAIYFMLLFIPLKNFGGSTYICTIPTFATFAPGGLVNPSITYIFCYANTQWYASLQASYSGYIPSPGDFYVSNEFLGYGSNYGVTVTTNLAQYNNAYVSGFGPSSSVKQVTLRSYHNIAATYGAVFGSFGIGVPITYASQYVISSFNR